MKTIDEIKDILSEQRGKRDLITSSLNESKLQLKKYKKRLHRYEKLRAIIQTVAQATQKNLEFHISELVTTALKSIFPDPYEFQIRFDLARGKTEATPYFIKDGQEIDPMDGSGCGPVDIAAFALKLSLWNIKKTRPCILLDEPFKHVSRDLQPKICELLKSLSVKMGLQFIIITHEEEMIGSADRIFRITQRKGISHASRIK